MRQEENNILTVRNLSKSYSSTYDAIQNVSFSIGEGECLGLVGESGSGKSTLVRCLLQMQRINNGEIQFQSHHLHGLRGKSLRLARRNMQVVFQDASAALNPKLKIVDSLMEPYDVMRKTRGIFRKDKERINKAYELLEMVKLPSTILHAYPHQLSGGMKQRVTIARAISTNPSLLLLDEPTSSLDVSVQASILNLLKDLQEKQGYSYLFISHDLSAVAFMSERIMVMKEGTIVDHFKKTQLFYPDRHSYTKELLSVYDS
ncbi:ATP-binding cassette domain-containing protein [Bacillus hwajinpoensis]|uniref:ATP-binding cassette domain-containing protein n=1 Tax=Guptibacillus hwajinpoensis TaxID=208199 RepID=A0A845F119_9BACL|nr:dipeptide/oligopeptide/nickel ABC transporter ATP-binding protein [Pseudalkalibacillus hwajinpoensis]MYL64405.1 ATP-binding cassette domain-containing protein [Pseudalkalibacillus hwajinpoensis]